jgi:hypothetical protein
MPLNAIKERIIVPVTTAEKESKRYFHLVTQKMIECKEFDIET